MPHWDPVLHTMVDEEPVPQEEPYQWEVQESQRQRKAHEYYPTPKEQYRQSFQNGYALGAILSAPFFYIALVVILVWHGAWSALIPVVGFPGAILFWFWCGQRRLAASDRAFRKFLAEQEAKEAGQCGQSVSVSAVGQ